MNALIKLAAKIGGYEKWRAILFCLTTLLLAGVRTEPATAQDDVQAAIAWFDRLGCLDASKAELVKIWRIGIRNDEKQDFQPAFLLETNKQSFKVINLSLEIQSFALSSARFPRSGDWRYETADLERSVNEYLESLKKLEPSGSCGLFLGQPLTSGVELFVLGRVCEKRGLQQQASRLFQKAKEELARPQFGRPAHEKPKSLRQGLIDRIAMDRLMKVVEEFGDPRVSRKEILAGFVDVIKRFPEGEEPSTDPKEDYFEWDLGRHARTAESYVRILRKMVKEDEDHARGPSRPEKNLSKKEQIAELIYQLRDQENPDATGFGPVDTSIGPAAQLVKLGYEAVPQLIEVMDDDRFTRTVVFSALNFYWDVWVARVGYCSQCIIEQIAGRQFDGDKAKIQSWWAEFRKKGEKQMLIEGAESGKNDSYIQAKRLIEKYPGVALDVIMRGVARADDVRLQAALVEISAEIKGEKAVTFLRRQLNGSALEMRLAAARGLTRRGISDGVGPMIEEWRRLATTESDADIDQLVKYLATCGQAEAMRALGHELLNRTIRIQRSVLEGVVDEERDQKIPVDVAYARDELLVQVLDNTERDWGSSDHLGDKEVRNPRLCDIAAYHLWRLWKLHGTYDIQAPLLTRDRNRIDLTNTWRSKKGLPLLPVPPRSKVNRLPDRAVTPKLAAILQANNSDVRQRAIKAVEALGLPALPAAREFLANSRSDHPAYADLKNLALRMACIVNQVEICRNSAKPNENLQRMIDALNGNQLDMTSIARLAVKATDPLPQGVIGFQVTIEREGDDSGVRLSFCLCKGNRQSRTFNTSESVVVNHRSIFDSGSGFSIGDFRVDHWLDFNTALQKAFAAGPESSVSARFIIYLLK